MRLKSSAACSIGGLELRDTYFSGVVLEKTPQGDRPVARAHVRTLRAGLNNSSSPSNADHEGRFRMLRAPGECSTLYGASPERLSPA